MDCNAGSDTPLRHSSGIMLNTANVVRAIENKIKPAESADMPMMTVPVSPKCF